MLRKSDSVYVDLHQSGYLVLEFVYLGDDDVDDAAQHDDEVESVPSVTKVVLNRTQQISFNFRKTISCSCKTIIFSNLTARV